MNMTREEKAKICVQLFKEEYEAGIMSAVMDKLSKGLNATRKKAKILEKEMEQGAISVFRLGYTHEVRTWREE